MLLQSFIKELVVVLPFYPVNVHISCPLTHESAWKPHIFEFFLVAARACVPATQTGLLGPPCPTVSGGHHGAHGSRRPSGHGQHLRANVQQPAVLRAPHAAPHLRLAHFAGAMRKFGLVRRCCRLMVKASASFVSLTKHHRELIPVSTDYLYKCSLFVPRAMFHWHYHHSSSAKTRTGSTCTAT